MANTQHKDLTGLHLHEAYHYVSDTDPGAVGASKYWLKTGVSPIELYRRNAGNSAWLQIGSSAPATPNLDDLGDVVITSPTNHQILEYSTALSRWVNAVNNGGVVTGATGTVDVKVYSATGFTWTKPSNAEWVEVHAFGGGGGGGGGSKTAGNSSGGGGGGSGAYAFVRLKATDLPSTVSGVAGAGGIAGAGATTNTTDGGDGGNGADSRFGGGTTTNYLRVTGGGQGGGGRLGGTGLAGSAGAGLYPGALGGVGIQGGFGNPGVAAVQTAGGGAGGGLSVAPAAAVGGVGGVPSLAQGFTPPPGGTTGGGSGTAGAGVNASNSSPSASTGGGGGGSSTTTAGGVGGNAGHGSGGGGGGAGLNSVGNGGNGGVGGPGLVIVISYGGGSGVTGPQGDPGADGLVQSIVAGYGIHVNSTDPANPVVSVSGLTGMGAGGNIITLLNTSDSLPVAPTEGDVVKFRDGLFDLYYDGTAWQALYGNIQITPPVDTDFTWVYQGTSPMASVATVQGRGIHIEVANDPADQWYVMSQPIIGGVGQSWTLTACAIFTGLHMNFTGMGILARYSSTGDFVGLAQYSSSTIRLQSIYGNNVPQLLGSYNDFTPWEEVIWFRLKEDGTNRFVYFSKDGIHWVLYNTNTNTEHTTVDELGFGITSRNGSGFGAMMDLIHWDVTYP